MNFKLRYGEWRGGLIHVHHIKPVSASIEKQIVNPYTDLVVLCANSHAMMHRKRHQILGIAELKSRIAASL
jgi:5-methylcytosine-specific restriction enzyme A